MIPLPTYSSPQNSNLPRSVRMIFCRAGARDVTIMCVVVRSLTYYTLGCLVREIRWRNTAIAPLTGDFSLISVRIFRMKIHFHSRLFHSMSLKRRSKANASTGSYSILVRSEYLSFLVWLQISFIQFEFDKSNLTLFVTSFCLFLTVRFFPSWSNTLQIHWFYCCLLFACHTFIRLTDFKKQC